MRALLLLLVLPSIASAVPVTLHHQGRLLDTTGLAINNSVALTVSLHSADSGAGNELTASVGSVTVENGYYSVALTVDSTLLIGDVWVQTAANGIPLGDRQPVVTVPRAAVAHDVDGGTVSTTGITVLADGHIALGHDSTETCPTDGALAFEPLAKELRLCVNGGWRRVPTLAPRATLTTVNGAREWNNGDVALSCNDYLNPGDSYTYTGDTGDGVYRIDPGTGPMTVLCNMTEDGGGWTLVLGSAALAHISGHYNDFWYTSAYRGATLSTTPSVLIETNGLLQNNAYWTNVRFTVDVDSDYSYILETGLWNGGSAEVNNPKFVRFNIGHNNQQWNGVGTCSSGCHAALAIPTDGANTNNGVYRIWGHSNGPPTWGLDSNHGIDIWVR